MRITAFFGQANELNSQFPLSGLIYADVSIIRSIPKPSQRSWSNKILFFQQRGKAKGSLDVLAFLRMRSTPMGVQLSGERCLVGKILWRNFLAIIRTSSSSHCCSALPFPLFFSPTDQQNEHTRPQWSFAINRSYRESGPFCDCERSLFLSHGESSANFHTKFFFAFFGKPFFSHFACTV